MVGKRKINIVLNVKIGNAIALSIKITSAWLIDLPLKYKTDINNVTGPDRLKEII